MRNTKLRGSRLSSRPFYTVILLLSTFAAYSFLAKTTDRHHTRQYDDLGILKRSSKLECNDVHTAEDQCAFVKEFCTDDDAGLIPYLQLYYCGTRAAQPVAFVLLVLWLGLLFTTIGIAASDFFSVNLSTIATILGLSESLAGVTFLAFGNGSPDVFSTFAAMSSNSASMAVGELIGAASFITGVVAGSMALVREFRVDRRTYARDIGFFFVAVCFTMYFLADGHLRFWECCVMVGYYVLYVVTVVFLHWYSRRRSERRKREGEARSHFYGSISHGGDELAGEPYRDDPDDIDNDRRASASSADLESAPVDPRPRIEIEGPDAITMNVGELEDDISDEDHERMVASEVASSMRVLRSRHRRSNTITPIRPSLIGALEFRSALAQLQRESNHKLAEMPDRTYSDHDLSGDSRGRSRSTVPGPVERERFMDDPDPSVSGRTRAWSSGDTPASASASFAPEIAVTSQDESQAQMESNAPDARQQPELSQPYTVGGNLAPPPVDSTGHTVGRSASGTSTPASERSLEATPRLLLQIPSRRSSQSDRSSPASPFPQFTDSPMMLTPNVSNAHDEQGEFHLPGPAHRDSPFVDLQMPIEDPRPIRWWPYAVLPPPHIVLATLFPTLQGWREKSYWDKLVSALSLPSLFLLVITLPVVETETNRGSSVMETIRDNASARAVGQLAPPVSLEQDSIEPENEWQRYRRYTLSRNNSYQSYRDVSPSMSPRQMSISQENTIVAQPATSGTSASAPGLSAKVASSAPSMSEANDESQGWNRWLVCVQLFTGPLFAVFILWANLSEEWDRPGRTLARMILYTLLGSLVALALLVTSTSEHRKPKFHYLLCFMGFVISIAWISTIAGEVVGVLKTVGVVLGISEALLGLTIFAAGNSVGDLVANITIARVGYPVMAL